MVENTRETVGEVEGARPEEHIRIIDELVEATKWSVDEADRLVAETVTAFREMSDSVSFKITAKNPESLMVYSTPSGNFFDNIGWGSGFIGKLLVDDDRSSLKFYLSTDRYLVLESERLFRDYLVEVDEVLPNMQELDN